MAESSHTRLPARDAEFAAQVERRPDGSLVTVLYRGGSRVHEQSVRSVRQGKRRAYDLLCTAVDTGGAAFPLEWSEPVPDRQQVKLPQQFSPMNRDSGGDAGRLLAPVATVIWSAHAGAH